MLTQETVSAYISTQLSNSASMLETLSDVRIKILQEHHKFLHEYEIVHTCTDVNNIVKQNSGNASNAEGENGTVDLFPRQWYSGRRDTRTGRLCRVRGMIQEIQSEMHLYAASRSDFFNAPCDENDEELLDATVLYVVPVPGNLHFYSAEKPTLAVGVINQTEQTSKLQPSVCVEHDTNAAKSNMKCTSMSTLPMSELSSMLAMSSNENNTNHFCANTVTRKRWQSETQTDKFAHWKEIDNNITMRESNNLLRNEELLQQKEERELHSLLQNVKPVQNKPFSLDAYLNFSHPAPCRNLQSACIVTVLAPKMHLAQNSFTPHHNYKNNHEEHEEENQSRKVQLINNGGAVLHINDIVDFYGFVQQPLLEQEELHLLKESNEYVTDEQRVENTHFTSSIYNKNNLQCNEMEYTIAEFDRWRVEELPFGLVPRLVCLAYAHVNTTPLETPSSSSLMIQEKQEEQPEVLTYIISTPRLLTSPSSSSMHCSCVAEMQPRVVHYLAHYICKGDILLSEYLLLHLCGRTVAHTAITPVGDVPLWIYSPNINAHKWSNALRAIAPIAELFIDKSLILDSEMRLHPQHDTTQNYLRTGLLQVGNGTHLTFDCDDLMSLFDHDNADSTNECGEREGVNEENVNETTTHSVNLGHGSNWKDALFALVHKQLLLLDYPYQTLELPVDVSILALSTTSRTSAKSNVKEHLEQQYEEELEEEEQQEEEQSQQLEQSLLRPQSDTQSKTNHSINANNNNNKGKTDIAIPALFDFALKLPWRPVTDSSSRFNKKEIEENSNSNSHQVDAGNVLLTSNEVRAYLLTVRRINPCFEYDQDNEEISSKESDTTNTISDIDDGNKISLHMVIAEAFTKLSAEIPHWLNRDPLVHNNTFSAVTALLRARAVSCGRSRVTQNDLEFVLSLERQRMERLQQA